MLIDFALREGNSKEEKHEINCNVNYNIYEQFPPCDNEAHVTFCFIKWLGK